MNNLLEILGAKKEGRKITMLTCYDFWSAKILNNTPVDILLVGDSAGMVMHGQSDTLPVSTEILAEHVRWVRRGAPGKFIVADMPFLSFRYSLDESLKSVHQLMAAGANAVKIEGVRGHENLVRHIVQSGVPVMGHLGLTPQSIHQFGGFKVQGRSNDQQKQILEDAQLLQDCGCFSVVLECVPAALAGEISASLEVPTIGIGAGVACDGQVLVLQDFLGLNKDFKPRFVRTYMDGAALVEKAVQAFCQDVQEKKFPASEESYQ